jgi:hypothetical protein
LNVLVVVVLEEKNEGAAAPPSSKKIQWTREFGTKNSGFIETPGRVAFVSNISNRHFLSLVSNFFLFPSLSLFSSHKFEI